MAKRSLIRFPISIYNSTTETGRRNEKCINIEITDIQRPFDLPSTRYSKVPYKKTCKAVQNLKLLISQIGQRNMKVKVKNEARMLLKLPILLNKYHIFLE
jgi:hypothetical protein